MRKRRFPIWAKTTILVFVFTLVLVGVAMVYFSSVLTSANKRTYMNAATNVSNTLSKVVEVEEVVDLKGQVKSIVDSSPTHPLSSEWGSPEWNAYIAQFSDITKTASFNSLRDVLRRAQSVNSYEISSIYILYVDPAHEFCVYLVDSAADEEACPPGCLDPLYEVNRETLTNPGRGFPAYFTNTPEYGYLVTAGTAIYSGNEVVALVCVDVSMDAVRETQVSSVLRFFAYLIITALLFAGITMFVVHLTIIRPMKRLNDITLSYDLSDPKKTHEAFQNLDVRRNDEIGDLANSMKKMENDIHQKIAELTKSNAELDATEKEVEKMTALANKDSLTGVRNKTAYDNDVEKFAPMLHEEDFHFGIVMIDLNNLKVINDEYGHAAGDAALIKLTNIICATFAHSPVYRVGGDEFVVILRHVDYRRSDKLIAEFNAKIEELQGDEYLTMPEKTWAAIGYAVYDPEKDASVEDVFNRADEAMYVRKRQMKGEDN